jgi:hypothetical protein
MSFNLGDVVPLSVTIRDADGQPANAGAVSLTVTLPDGTTDVTSNITPTATGVYDHDYPTVQAGVHQVRWVATGENASAFEDAFSVAPAAGLNFISLTETKKHLQKDLTKTADDADLLEFITAACSKIVELIGPVAPVDVTEEKRAHWFDARHAIVLSLHPVIGVSSVTIDGRDEPDASSNAGVGWILDSAAGILRHSSCWPYGSVTVTYRAGRTPLPGNIRLAALELTGHLWKQSQLNTGSTTRPPSFGDDQVIVPGLAYALPLRVRELLGLGQNPTSEILIG